jgi:hypothetical protein
MSLQWNNGKFVSGIVFWYFSLPWRLLKSALKCPDFFQDLINFAKDNGLQSSTPAARNASVKLIGVLHRFLGPGFKTTKSLTRLNFFQSVTCYWYDLLINRGFSVSADIKGFLNDLKPTLQGAIDAEIEKNPYEVFLLLLK